MPETSAEIAERIAVVCENQAALAVEFFGEPRDSVRVRVYRDCARLAREAGQGAYSDFTNDRGQLAERIERVRALLTSGPIGSVSGERYIRADLIRAALANEPLLLPEPPTTDPAAPERA